MVVTLLLAAVSGASSFAPATVNVAAGGTASTDSSVSLDAVGHGDVVFALDTTGSMADPVLANAQADVGTIINDLQSDFPAKGALAYGLINFRDYVPSVFDSNPQDSPPGPYRLQPALPASASAVTSVLNSLSTGDGGDFPESYFRVFDEASKLSWESGARRILVVLGDQTGHDNHQADSYPSCPNSPTYTDAGGNDVSVDPGDGTSGPLSAATAVNDLVSAQVSLSFLTYSTATGVPDACHAELAAPTGGSDVPADAMAAHTLAGKIQALIGQGAGHVNSLSATVTNPDGSATGPASWVTVSRVPSGPLDLPQSFSVHTVVNPPADATPGEYHVNVNIVADGVTAATQQLTINVRIPLTGVAMTVTPSSAPAGIDDVPIGGIPNGWLSFLAGTTAGLQSFPVGSTPVGSTPVGSTPVGSTPVGSTPVGSTPVGSTPVGSTPVGSTPVGSTSILDLPVGSTPVGSTALGSLLLSQIQLCGDAPIPGTSQCPAGATWSALLDGTPLAGQPLNALTLADVAGNTTAKGRLAALPLAAVSFATTLFKSVRWSSLLIGSVPLSALPGGFTAWCGSNGLIPSNGGSCTNATETTTVLQMDVAGQLGSAPVGSTPVGSTPVGSTPVGSTPVGSTTITSSRLATVRLADMTPASDIVNCAGSLPAVAGTVDCAGGSLGDAYTADAIKPTVTFSAAALQPAFTAAGITVNDLLVAILSAGNFPWEQLPIQGLQPYSEHQSTVTYQISTTVDCSVVSSFSAVAQLPDGFFPVHNSSTVTYGTSMASLADPAIESPTGTFDGPATLTTATVAAPTPSYAWPLSCPDSTSTALPVVVAFKAYTGLTLGKFSSTAAVGAGTFSLTANDQAPVTVGQNWEANDDPSTASTIKDGTLVAGHIAFSGDQDFYKLDLSGLPRGTKIAAFLKVPANTDLDLTISKPSAPSFFSVPVGSTPVGSTPIEDNGVGFSTFGTALPSETLQDVPVGSTPVGSTPVGSTPVGSTSTNRGDVNEAAQIITQGEGGYATIGISGYNGASSNDDYVLRIKETPPPPLPPNCPAPTFPNGSPANIAPGTLPSSLPSSTQSLFILDKQRLVAMYGAPAVTSMLNALTTLAARSEVAGSILYVDGNATVRSAYAAWDAKPCDTTARNNVVRAINDVVAGYRNAGLSKLHYVVLVGTDQATPMANVPDPVTLSPEENEAADLAFTTNALTTDNPLYASAAQNNILSDGAYGAFTSIAWLGQDLLLPQLSVSRLVETPGDIVGQINQYLQSSGYTTGTPQSGTGTLKPTSDVVTGYDFLADGAKSVRDNLVANFSGISTTATFPSGDPAIQVPGTSDTPWTATDVVNSVFTAAAPPSIASLNAHYNHYEFEAANRSLGNTGQVTSNLPSRILFTMGCHGGLNIANTVGSGGTTGKYLDWPELYAKKKVAIYIGNTGYGYGDSDSIALSERLLSLYAKNLRSDSSSVGEEWARTLGQYFATAGAYDVYDQKVMEETTFYGLPFWHFSGAPSGSTYTPPRTTADPITGTQSATFSFPGTGAVTQNQFGLYRPDLSITSQETSGGSLPARGIWIKSLQSVDTANVTAKLGMPTIDLTAHEPVPKVNPIFFPASPFTLDHSVVFGTQHDFANVSDQFRPNDPADGKGTLRHFTSASLEIFYSSTTDNVAPLISQVNVSFDGTSSAAIQARVTDDSGTVAEVAALVNDGTWHYLQLTKSSQDPTLWTGVATGLLKNPEVFIEGTDGANVSYSANKGSNFTSAPSTQAAGPQILISAPSGSYTLGQAVVASYQCISGAVTVAQCIGTQPSGTAIDTTTPGVHTFVVQALDASGNVLGSLQRTYVVGYTFKGFVSPIANPPTVNLVNAGSSVPLKFSLTGNQGLDIFADGYPVSQPMVCGGSGIPDSMAPTDTSGQSTLTYEPKLDQYNYSWKTDTGWLGTCRVLIVKLKDGSVHLADFKFK